MAKFIKIKFNDGRVEWRKMIDSKEGLDKHHAIDVEVATEEVLSLEREDDVCGLYKEEAFDLVEKTPRAVAFAKMINAKSKATPKGDKVYPISELANFMDKGYIAKLKHINNGGAITINPAGGWCDLDTVTSSWKAEIIEQIETSSEGIPSDEKAINANTLILENSISEYADDLTREVTSVIGAEKVGVIKAIYGLKNVDTNYLIQCINKSQNIFISSMLADNNQVDQFMKLFSEIPCKNVYLSLEFDGKETIETHPLFEANNKTHNIIFC